MDEELLSDDELNQSKLLYEVDDEKLDDEAEKLDESGNLLLPDEYESPSRIKSSGSSSPTLRPSNDVST